MTALATGRFHTGRIGSPRCLRSQETEVTGKTNTKTKPGKASVKHEGLLP